MLGRRVRCSSFWGVEGLCGLWLGINGQWMANEVMVVRDVWCCVWRDCGYCDY